jgi:hypothetical protein
MPEAMGIVHPYEPELPKHVTVYRVLLSFAVPDTWLALAGGFETLTFMLALKPFEQSDMVSVEAEVTERLMSALLHELRFMLGAVSQYCPEAHAQS